MRTPARWSTEIGGEQLQTAIGEPEDAGERQLLARILGKLGQAEGRIRGIQRAVGSVNEVVRAVAVNAVFLRGWVPDGRLLTMLQRKETGTDVGLVSVDGSARLDLLLHASYNEGQPGISPNGQRLVYTSTETGSSEVYVQRFPELRDKKQLSVVGVNSHSPIWSRDGQALFYLAGTSRSSAPTQIRRVAIGRDVAEPFGPSEKMLDFSYFAQANSSRYYDLSKDSRFLMISGAPEGLSATEMTVALNWSEELKGRVPSK